MNRLRLLRETEGLSQRDLARRSRVGAPYLSLIERHNYMPGRAVRARVARALGVSELDIWPNLGHSTITRGET